MARNTEKICPRCGKVSDATAKARARWNYLCRACAVAEVLARRARDRAAGKIVKFKLCPASQARRYQRDMADPVKRQHWKARAAVRSRVKRGTMLRQPCEVCGAERVEAHHDDYSQPLNVRWLCPAHHREHHAAERARLAA